MRPNEAAEHERVLSAHGNSVWRLIVRIFGNDGHDAADCFQQTFVEMLSRQMTVSGVRDAGALLKRIATRRAIDVVRRRIRDRRRTDDADATLVAAGRESQPVVQAEMSEFLDDLRVALAELPEPQSTAFVLTQIEDLSHQEAASAMGTTANHLGVLLHRARKALRRRLDSHTPTGEPRP